MIRFASVEVMINFGAVGLQLWLDGPDQIGGNLVVVVVADGQPTSVRRSKNAAV